MLTESKPVRRRPRLLTLSLTAVLIAAVVATALPGAPTATSAARSDKSITALCDQTTDAVEAGYATSLRTTAAHSTVAVHAQGAAWSYANAKLAEREN